MTGQRDQNDREFEFVEGELPERSVLEDVLRETMQAGPGQMAEPIHEQELQAMLGVARRYAVEPVTLSPVAVELVEAILRSRLSQLQAPAEYWRAMSLTIASSILDAPVSRRRLNELWSFLCETVR